MAAPLHEIRLLVETDDEALLARLADQIALLACPQDDASPDHRCPVPWFVIESEVEDPETWRELLNR
jgi:hypothetical protein